MVWRIDENLASAAYLFFFFFCFVSQIMPDLVIRLNLKIGLSRNL